MSGNWDIEPGDDDGNDLVRVLLVCAIGLLAMVMLGCTSGSGGGVTVEGYVQFWLGLCGAAVVIVCVVAGLIARFIVKELRSLRVELGGVREVLHRYQQEQVMARMATIAKPKAKR